MKKITSLIVSIFVVMELSTMARAMDVYFYDRTPQPIQPYTSDEYLNGVERSMMMMQQMQMQQQMMRQSRQQMITEEQRQLTMLAQRFYNTKGYNIAVDGVAGPQTQAAYRDYVRRGGTEKEFQDWLAKEIGNKQ
jgi:hypothetical protein